jgi:hypothetical protein
MWESDDPTSLTDNMVNGSGLGGTSESGDSNTEGSDTTASTTSSESNFGSEITPESNSPAGNGNSEENRASQDLLPSDIRAWVDSILGLVANPKFKPLDQPILRDHYIIRIVKAPLL